MLTVGVTGRSGSGKSSVTAYYASLGYPTADGDQLSRRVTEKGTPCLRELAGAFGPDILQADGSLDRKKLGGLVFGDKEKNKQLISITHPYIINAFQAEIDRAKKKGARLFFADGAVIVGGPFEAYCDRLLVVVSELRLSVSRIILRDGISKTAALKRLEAQTPEADLRRAANYLIENNGSLETLHQKADEILQHLLAEDV